MASPVANATQVAAPSLGSGTGSIGAPCSPAANLKPSEVVDLIREGKEPFDYSLYDLAVRRLVQLEDEMYKNCNDRRWRHIIDSEFSVLSQAEQTPCCMRSIREQFFGARIKHEINRCRMIVVPAQVLFDWCVYFWDFKKKRVHVFDPFYKMEENEFYQKKHSSIVEKIKLDIDTVSANFFDKWDIDWKDWHNDYVKPPLPVVPWYYNPALSRDEEEDAQPDSEPVPPGGRNLKRKRVCVEGEEEMCARLDEFEIILQQVIPVLPGTSSPVAVALKQVGTDCATPIKFGYIPKYPLLIPKEEGSNNDNAIEFYHENFVDEVTDALFACIEKLFSGWKNDKDEWIREYPTHVGPKCRTLNSGLNALHYARAFTGNELAWKLCLALL
ncbi:hypothetical protein EJB05_47273 [Eragrostis curvula]|uniref:Uncharacterized protein n=1 Tax=Eragrostis curvula TaxID=38414 RepID=A0A5J9T8B7_9POAL|nr:hypothetical protein EJB05_47273 [Eragrostis curvula]